MFGLFAKPFGLFSRFFRSDIHASLKLIVVSILLAIVTALPWLTYGIFRPEYWHGGGPMWPALILMPGYALGQLGVVIGGVWFLCSLFFGSMRGENH